MRKDNGYWFEFVVIDWNQQPEKTAGTLHVHAIPSFNADGDFLDAEVCCVKRIRKEIDIPLIKAMSIEFYNELVSEANAIGKRKYAKGEEKIMVDLDGYENNYD